MSFKITYKPFFQVNLYHHYFLDDGTTAFDSNANLKKQQLAKYDRAQYINIAPSAHTQNILEGQKLVVKNTASGFKVFIKASEYETQPGSWEPFTKMENDIELTFLLKIEDRLFENYSTVSANPSLPFYFSNVKPSTETGSFQTIDLENTTHPIADFTISDDTFSELEKQLRKEEKQGLFGIILLKMYGDDASKNILNVNRTLKVSPTIFKIQMQNRKTVWNYLDASTRNLIHSSDPTALPLVKNGIVGYSFSGEKRPAANAEQLLFEKDTNGNITKTISEIYIN